MIFIGAIDNFSFFIENEFMNHKTFVFFDCECANTFEGIGKICSLGYVIADDELNILESEDVVMNPECDFDWYLFSGKGECQLAYSKDYFRIKPNFEAFYKDIKKLFTTGNRFIGGFAVGNDVGFVNNACERYNLPYIQFRAFDLERYLERKYDKKQKLVQWAQEFGVNVAKYQSHKSVDDAIITMLCLKAEAAKCGKTVEEIMTEHKDCFVSNEQILEQAAERAYRKEMTEKIKRLFNKKNPKPKFKKLLGERFEFDGKLMREVDLAFELIKQIYENGGIVNEHVMGHGTAVFLETPNEHVVEKLKKRGLKIILAEELFSQMNGQA